MTPSVKKTANDIMDKYGIGIERRSEAIARAVAEVALHLVGGPHRLTPKNSHQKPVVVLLCGNHPEAAGAVCAARHLATLGVRTVVYFHGSSLTSYLQKEMELYKLTGHAIINNEKSKCTLVVNARMNLTQFYDYRLATRYCRFNFSRPSSSDIHRG